MKIWAAAAMLALGTTIVLARIPAEEPASPPATPLNDVIAEVGSEKISYSQLNTMLNSSAIVGLSMPALGTPERNRVRITLLDKVISANLLYLDAKQKGVDRSPAYVKELTEYQDAILSALYRERHLIGDLSISEDEIQTFFKESIQPGTEFTDEVRTSIEATLRKNKFQERTATVRERVRLGLRVDIQKDNLDPANDSARKDSDRLATIEGGGIDRRITWGDVDSILSIPGNAGSMDARLEALNKQIDNTIMATRGRQAGLEADPVYQARVGEFQKTRLITLHRHELLKDMEPTEEELTDYYYANAARIQAPESRKLQMIVVATEDEAKTLKQRIDAGELTIYQAAQEYSIDPNAKQTLGDFGWVTKGSGFPALDELAFSTVPDKLVGPVESPAGWHLITVLDSRVARYQSLDEPDTKQFVRRLVIKHKLDQYTVQLRKEAFPVVVHQDRLNELFTREAEWIAALEKKAAEDPSIAAERIKEFERVIK